jgi:hypothetical protein
MHKPIKPIVGALLMIAIGTPGLFAQYRHSNGPAAATSDGDGTILWQYDTHG